MLRGAVEFEGLENVPRTGRLIIGVNHVSMLDPLLAAVAVYRVRYPRFVGKEELFRVPLLGRSLGHLGAIPLNRGRADVGAIRKALEVLDGEGCMVLFPEGTRARPGKPGRPKSGIGLLARESRAPVLPARVFDTVPFFSRRPLRIRFGEPICYTGGGGRSDDMRFAGKVMEQIFYL